MTTVGTVSPRDDGQQLIDTRFAEVTEPRPVTRRRPCRNPRSESIGRLSESALWAPWARQAEPAWGKQGPAALRSAREALGALLGAWGSTAERGRGGSDRQRFDAAVGKGRDPRATVRLGAECDEDETEVSAIWLFTEDGFYSGVSYDRTRDYDGLHSSRPELADDPIMEGRILLVRTRDEEDMKRLVAKFAVPIGYRSTPRADYPFKVLLAREEWARYLSEAARDLDYPNFKSRVQQRSGSHRHDVYLRVWSAMRGMRGSA